MYDISNSSESKTDGRRPNSLLCKREQSPLHVAQDFQRSKSRISCRQTAVREFVEETDTMFLASDLSRARRTPARIAAQIPVMDTLLGQTLDAHPDWWCQRAPGTKIPPKDWRTYFVAVEHRDVDDINAQWAGDDGSRFKKPRELLWVPGDELLAIIDTTPERLWKRVRQLIGARETVEAILTARDLPSGQRQQRRDQ